MLEITISNAGQNLFNTREGTYSDYQAVRLIEGNTNRIIFYGKIEKRRPEFDAVYQQVLILVCRDNFNELLKRQINTDYSGFTQRHALIDQILTNYSYSTNIDRSASTPTKFNASDETEAANQINQNFVGGGKNVLRAISDLALRERTSGNEFGFDYYLDNTFSLVASNTAGVAGPDMHYFRRGTIPAGGASSSGLTVQYQGTQAAQVRAVLPDFNFPRESHELVTRCKIDYTDETNVNRSVEGILINHGAVTNGPFTAGEALTWAGGGSAIVRYVDPGNTFLVIGEDSVGDTDWLITVVGLVVTGGTSTATATVNTAAASPPGSLREAIAQDIEVSLRSFEIERADEAWQTIAETLHHAEDTITRGNFRIMNYPYYTLTGTHDGPANSAYLQDTGRNFANFGVFHGDEVENTTDSSATVITSLATQTNPNDRVNGTLAGGTDNDWDVGDAYRIYVMVRTGHVIRVNISPPSINEDMLVTKIVYEEGVGIQTSYIEVMSTSSGTGRSIPRGIVKHISDNADDGLWVLPGTSPGAVPLGLQPFNTNLEIRGTDFNDIIWDNGTAVTDATINFADGTARTIADSNIAGLSVGDHWLYIETSGADPLALTDTTTFSDAISSTRVLLAMVTVVADDGSGSPLILPFTGKSATISATAIAANAILAGNLTANLVLTTSIISGTAGSDRWEITPTHIAGYDGAALQVEFINSGGNAGRIEAGGGSVIIDSNGVHFVGGTGTGDSLAIFESSAGVTEAVIFTSLTEFTLLTDAGTDIRLNAGADDIILDGTAILPGTNSAISLGSSALAFSTLFIEEANGIEMQPHGVLAGNTSEIRFLELAASGTNYVGFKGPDAIAGNQIWTLPNADGSANQVIRTDGSDDLSWADISDINGTITDAQHGSRSTANAHNFTGLAGTISAAQHGSVAVANAHAHSDLALISANQHHNQSHNNTDHSTNFMAESGGSFTGSINFSGDLGIDNARFVELDGTVPSALTEGRIWYDSTSHELEMQANVRTNVARIATGQYTGDGTISQSITGIGFTPIYVRIWRRVTGDGINGRVWETTTSIIDDNASGQAWEINDSFPITRANAIITLGTDGFTVDDDGADADPNTNTQVYNFMCIG